jgi:hypothetical protein
MNLLSSFADDKPSGPTQKVQSLEGIETLEEDEDSGDWMGEYQRGCDWEIYSTDLSENFEGSRFCDLSNMLYKKLGIVLFGLEVEDLSKDKNSIKLVLNPADFVIPPKSQFCITAFVIAKNKAQSDLSLSKEVRRRGCDYFRRELSDETIGWCEWCCRVGKLLLQEEV